MKKVKMLIVAGLRRVYRGIFSKRVRDYIYMLISDFRALRSDADVYGTFLSRFFVRWRDGDRVDENHVITTLDNGKKLIVNIHDKYVCLHTRLKGRWAFDETAVLNRIIKHGFKIVEVGSNFGVHTIRMADLVGESGEIFAFEINPNVSKWLKDSVKLNNFESRVRVYEMGLGSRKESVKLMLNKVNIGASYVGQGTESSHQIDVFVDRMDNVLPDVKIDLLKMDVEGFEPFVLEGAERTLAQTRMIMMEFVPAHLKRNNVSFPKFFSLLYQANFNHVYVIEREGILKKITFDELEKMAGSIAAGDLLLSKEPVEA